MPSRGARAARSELVGVVLIALLASCSPPSSGAPTEISCASPPPFERTADTLAACLPAQATAEDAACLLREWHRIDDEWGCSRQADVLPGGGPELLVCYHADLTEVSWNPQGRFYVLRRGSGGWHVAFDLDGARLGIRTVDGTPWDNWSYHVLDVADLTGDGLDDMVAELRYSNGLHVGFRHLALLTAHPDTESGGGDTARSPGLRVAYLEDTTLTRPTYHLLESGGRKVLQSVISVGKSSAITRTLAFTGNGFQVVGEEINPAASTVSAKTSDGAQWYGFDMFDGGGGSSMYDPVMGLYRLQEGRLQHFDMPGTLRALEVGPEGSLYAAGGLGVMRYRDGRWETLLDTQGDPAMSAAPFVPFDIDFGPNGELWVGGIHSLARFESGAWTQIVMPARRLLVAPDGSIWAEGWDGRAGSDCCFNHLTGSTWVTYTHSAVLPVAPDLEERIRELKR